MRRNSRAPHASVGQVGGVVPRRLPTAPHQRTRRRKVERQTNRGRDEHGDRDTQSGPLHDWESNRDDGGYAYGGYPEARSEEHTSELQSLMRISYAVFCLQKKNNSTKTLL